LEAVAPVNPRRNFDGVPDDANLTFLGMASVAELTGALKLHELRPVAAVRSGFTRFYSGDVLFAKITPCMENGKLAIIPELPFGAGAGSTEFHVLEPQKVSARYLFYWLSQRWFRQEAEHNMTGTAGQKRVPTEWLRQSVIPVPSPDQQVRLVTRIETLFAEVEEGERLLDEVGAIEPYQGMIGTLRQSILAAAFRGRLAL
jgi:type I restriction enzyme S subunit